MKPKIGETVYTLYRTQIYKETVGYLGAQSFIVDFYSNEDNTEYEYDDYNKEWFRSLDKAKKELRRRYGRKTIEQVANDCWEVVEDD